MGRFIKLCSISKLPERRGIKFTIDDDTEIIAYSIDGKYYAAANTCPHNHSHQMHEGYVDENLYLTCPIHGYKFQLETGEVPPDSIEMSGKLKLYKTKVENDELYVEKRDSMLKFWKW
jgi:nitrite reductase/ring-hydroxylating ferredoxin subunit